MHSLQDVLFHSSLIVPIRRRLWLLGVVVLLLASSLLTRKLVAQGAGGRPSPVVAAKVRAEDVTIEQTFVGTVMPLRTSLVGSEVEGRVIEYLVEEGDYVEQGQKLAQLRPTRLEIQLAGAEAQRELLQKQLEDLEVSLPIQIERARARKEAAEALQKYASQQYERGKDLGDNTPIADAELEELKSSAFSAQGVLSEREAALQLSEDTLSTQLAQAQTQIRVQEERIRELRDTISQHTITAPFSGFVTQEHTEVGQWLTQGGAVAEIVEIDEVEIVLQVLETQIPELRARAGGEAGTKTSAVSVEAFPDETFEGEVAAIVPRADYQSRTFPVKVRVPNRRHQRTDAWMLKPGMFARVTLPIRRVTDAVLIPKDALVLDRRSRSVWVVKSPDAARNGSGSAIRRVPVEINAGVSVGGRLQIIGPRDEEGKLPIMPGEEVITEGNERVNVRSHVTITGKESSG